MPAYKKTAIKFPLQARLRDRSSGAAVPADIGPMAESDVELWGLWQYPKDAGDRSWEWDRIFADTRRPGGENECYAVVAQEELQGLMSLALSGKRTAEGQALVVEYLASNPANRYTTSGLKDVGVALVALAVHRSREIGWAGRLWLESLPEAAAFYEHCGFIRLPGISADGFDMFWLSEDAADALWRKARKAGILSLPQ